MRFLSIRADAFGPFPPDATLQLTPGLNIVYGPNEAGKSSWHAALYAGLCGIRRGQGRPALDDQLFAEKHRPWANDESAAWAATTVVELQDGRRLELRQDLASRTAEIADPATGRPVFIDLINDGAPDGARLLGLDRRAFVATACVRQADLLRVRESAGNLQEYLGKAVATGRDDATVVSAMNAIDRYFDDYVGSDRAPTKPWRKAGDAVTRLTRKLLEAEHAHQAHLALIARGEDARAEAEKTHHSLDLVLARQAAREADGLEARLGRAAELQPLFAGGAPPTALDDDELANLVAVAIAHWHNQPAEPRLTGSTADQIRIQLAALPHMPEADLDPHESVLTAWDGLKTAATAQEEQAALEPPLSPEPDSGGLNERDLRQLAFDLGRSGEQVNQLDPSTQAPAENAPNVPPAWLIGGGALVAVLGLILLLASPLVGALLLIIGPVVGAWGLVSRRKRESAHTGAARAQVAERMKAEESARLRKEAEIRAFAAGLPADTIRLQTLAESIAATRAQRHAHDAWAQRQLALRSALADSVEELRKALRGRSIEPGPDLEIDFIAYEKACRERQALAAEAGMRPALQSQLEAREAAEKGAAEALLLRQQARQSVIDASTKCGFPDGEVEQMVTSLQGWVNQRELRLQELDSLRSQWTELTRLLDGRSLDELGAAAEESRKAADALARNLSADELDATLLEPDVKAQVERLRKAHQSLAQTAAEIQGQIGTESGRVPSVPLTEEELAAADAELDRVTRLRDTLNKTKQYLEVAQDRVNHDIAPVLNDSVGRRLAQITGGRYSEVRVDPEDLNVRVRLTNGALQPAYLLSHGTAEQVYLLLRVAMAERLTKAEEVCPLILDDVTVQSDGERTRAILETLQAISAERQIVLFTQEEDVLAWAEATLQNSTQDQLVRLN
jgi:DNA repair exonuclease SbcCD ATPase subunit